ncbi:MAG: copper resistance protein NlpE [Pseudomonadota bacterium]|nr:copper resistance protein NlpE [Pseudomonadota bacterium]
MISKRAAIAMACLVFAAACNRNAEPETAAPPLATPASTDMATTPDAGMPADAPAPIAAEEPFMTSSFAGTFSAADSSITLGADGSYTAKLGDAMSEGTWTADARGMELLLDPHSKAEADRKYSVVSKNQIRAIDGGANLQREGVAQ